MNLYSGLLFMQGHIASVELAKQLTREWPKAADVTDQRAEPDAGKPDSGKLDCGKPDCGRADC